MTNKIDISKRYRTRDGREVLIYSTDTGHGFDQVHGAIKEVHGWEMSAWGHNGMKDVSGIRQTLNDLVEVKPRIKRTYWANIYGTGLTYHDTKEEANNFQMGPILACVKIEIDCEEGEGL
jgi:hypothetical protein